MILAELIVIAKRVAVARGLDPSLICAMCEQESAWDAWAYRWEPAFYAKYIVPLNLTDHTEATMRATSWGLLQVMGQVAYEHGFRGFYSQLCDPEIGIQVGCKVLKAKIDRAGGDVRKGVLAYNGGGRPQYVDEVFSRMSRYA